MAARRTFHRTGAAIVALGIVGGALVPGVAAAADPSADLSVTISHSPSTVTTAQTVTFTVTAANAGPDAAAGTVVGIGFPYQLMPNPIPEPCRRASNYESLVCDLGEVPSGSESSLEFTVTAQGSGLFSIPVAVAADTDDPVTTNQTATDTIVVKPGERQGERYIKGIFPIILQRPVDAGSLTYWADRWRAENDRWPRALDRLPYALMQSNEYRRIQIRAAYLRILGRAADAPSLTYWTNKARSGWSYDRIEQALFNSSEFGRANASDVVGGVFDGVLGRAPSATERARFEAALGTGSTRAALAAMLQRSTERFDQIIVERYQAALGHGPSAAGRYGWQVELRNGKSVEQLWARLFVLGEFLDDYPYTDDDYLDEEFVTESPDVAMEDVIGALAEG
jgi:hypothetical protein